MAPIAMIFLILSSLNSHFDADLDGCTVSELTCNLQDGKLSDEFGVMLKPTGAKYDCSDGEVRFEYNAEDFREDGISLWLADAARPQRWSAYYLNGGRTTL
jgi:hypothetical protein